MANISAKDVMELRKKTGCGMMECKKALVETEGNFDEAIKYLREKGLAVAAKKADRIAAEGVVDILSENGVTAIIEVNAETDFVAKNASFQEFVKGILRTIVANKPADLAALNALNFDGTDVTVEAELKNMIFTIGENMSIRRFDIIEGTTGCYIHGGGSAGVVTKFETACDANDAAFVEYAKNVCMQIAAMSPSYVDRDCVPASVIENEKAILLSQIENDENLSKKPDAVKEKMVIGRISKFYDNNCLVDQEYVKDSDLTVGKYTENVAKELGNCIKIVSFVKYERGEGIEKKEDDFAAEINKLVNG
ncbi:MAG: elongation factor Ts [Clostridia bacterium]|nr:elongation factor Ts [Clostridia bacterium]